MKNKAPKSWQKVKLGELGNVITGKTPPTSQKDYFKPDFPFITPTDIIDYDVRYNYTTERFVSEKWANKAKNLRIPKNATCFVCIGSTIGKMCLVRQESFTNQQINSVVVDESKANQLFIYYLLKQNQKGILREFGGGGAAKPIINKSTFEGIELEIPEHVSEQRQIVSALSAFDDKIELNNKIAKTLEEIAQAIFKEWFVHFKFPVYEKAEFIDSELGKIPEGWKLSQLSDIATIIMGQSPSSEFYNKKNVGLPFHQGVTNFGGRFPNHEIFCTQNNRVAEEGDLLFSVRAPVGRINIADIKISLGRGVAGIRHKNNYQSYLYYLLKRLFRKEDSLGGGSVFPSVTKDDMESMKMLIPAEELVKKFENIVSGMDRKIEMVEKENQKLAVLRDLLLPKLMRGEIRV